MQVTGIVHTNVNLSIIHTEIHLFYRHCQELFEFTQSGVHFPVNRRKTVARASTNTHSESVAVVIGGTNIRCPDNIAANLEEARLLKSEAASFMVL